MKTSKDFWKKWKNLARIVANIQAQIIFTIFYFLVLWVVGFIFRLVADPLHIKNNSLKSCFSDWDHPTENLNQASKPY